MGRRSNYGYEKRQKELKRKKKQEMKRLKKQGKLSEDGLEPGIPAWGETSMTSAPVQGSDAPESAEPAEEETAEAEPAEENTTESQE